MTSLTMNPARLTLRHLTNGSLPRLVGRSIRAPTPLLHARLQSTTSRLPRLAQSSVWTSMIPRFIRDRGTKDANTESPKSKEWNPASFYIIIFILIGSQAIRMIALKNDYNAYTRTTDAKILLLREVIERIKNGETVDVEKLLGTGDAAKEREWDEVLREIEEEDSLWHQKNKKNSEQEQTQQEEKQQVQSTKEKDPVVPAEGNANDEPPEDSRSKRKLNFY